MFDAVALIVFGLAVSLLTAGFGIKNQLLLTILEFFSLNPSDDLLGRFRLAVILGGLVITLFVLKSILQITVTSLLFRLLEKAEIEFIENTLRENSNRLLNYESKETLDREIHKLMSGSSALFSRSIGQYFSIASDAASILMICALLVLFQPIVALGTALYFTLIGYLFSISVSNRARKLGATLTEFGIKSDRKLRDYLENFKVIDLAGTRQVFERDFLMTKHKQIRAQSESILVSSFPRHFIETSMVLGFFLLAVLLFFTMDWSTAASTLLLFLAAASRIAPVFVSILGALTSIGGAKADVNLLLGESQGRWTK